MKKMKLIVMFMTLGLMSLLLFNCDSDDETLESCAQDEFCTIPVTSCCKADGCVWKYDGKEYTPEQEDELATELGCGSARVAAGEKEQIVLKLQALMNEAKRGLQ